jgi:ribonuclease Z
MKITTLGTGGPIPDANRAGPATLVQANGHDLLFDCGRGVLMRAAAAFSGPASLDTVFLTHLHSDHVTDLNDVITMRWVMSMAPNPLRIIGPVGTEQFVERTMATLSNDISYRLAHHADLSWRPACEVTEVSNSVVLEHDGLVVRAAPTDHMPVHPTVGYRVDAGGRSVVIAGDTIPCAGLDSLCEGADAYVQTVVRRSLVESFRFLDILDYHSSIQDAAKTAARNSVKTLVMTHLVPSPPAGTEQEWADEAALDFDGKIIVASDLTRIELPKA